MNPQTFVTSLAAIRHAGSVSGLVLARRREIWFQETGFPEPQVQDLVAAIDDIVHFFEQDRTCPDQMVFGYEEGNLLLLLFGEFRMVVLHDQADEADFVARAARAFLKDRSMDLLAKEWGATS
ncbi:MAG TPA: hypothetical protein PLA50_09095 [Bacteroidia bacterium]|nr:hypothetical protein [Bacteroidia bacterium]